MSGTGGGVGVCELMALLGVVWLGQRLHSESLERSRAEIDSSALSFTSKVTARAIVRQRLRAYYPDDIVTFKGNASNFSRYCYLNLVTRRE